MTKKILTTMIVIVSFIITGCTSEINKPISQIESYIVNNCKLDGMVKGDGKSLRRFYGINPNDLEGFTIYTPKSNMDVDEMLIVKVKDSSQIEAIEESIDDRVNKQIENFNGYGAEQVALLENYEIKIKDKYVFYVVSKDAEKIKELFKDSIKS